jgi:hypothetical protein
MKTEPKSPHAPIGSRFVREDATKDNADRWTIHNKRLLGALVVHANPTR